MPPSYTRTPNQIRVFSNQSPVTPDDQLKEFTKKPGFVMAEHCYNGDEQVLEVVIRGYRLSYALITDVFANYPRLDTLVLEDVNFQTYKNEVRIPPHRNMRTLYLRGSTVTQAVVEALPDLDTLVMTSIISLEIQPNIFLIDCRLFETFVWCSRKLKSVQLNRIVLKGKPTTNYNVSVTNVFSTSSSDISRYFPLAKLHDVETPNIMY
ncbi:hypothetical protein CPC16_006479 [Podila verticillata]|nr:hypothetical protein CPC16_006479 [Podila verticillata]